MTYRIPKKKYGNKKVKYDGATFDSKAEKDRYVELRLLERAGRISELHLQPPFKLLEKQKGEQGVKYIADFIYKENGKTIVEDVKSKATAKDKAYIIKRKLFKQKYEGVYVFRETICRKEDKWYDERNIR